jgi:hypothetical protein
VEVVKGAKNPLLTPLPLLEGVTGLKELFERVPRLRFERENAFALAKPDGLSLQVRVEIDPRRSLHVDQVRVR